MGIDYQLYRAWANTAKGIRQCQKADSLLQKDKADAAGKHFSKALSDFGTAVDHLAKAENDADVKAGELLDDGNQQLQKAIDRWTDGDDGGAEKH